MRGATKFLFEVRRFAPPLRARLRSFRARTSRVRGRTGASFGSARSQGGASRCALAQQARAGHCSLPGRRRISGSRSRTRRSRAPRFSADRLFLFGQIGKSRLARSATGHVISRRARDGLAALDRSGLGDLGRAVVRRTGSVGLPTVMTHVGHVPRSVLGIIGMTESRSIGTRPCLFQREPL